MQATCEAIRDPGKLEIFLGLVEGAESRASGPVHEYPSVGTMAISAAKAVGHLLAGGMASHGEQARRMAICEACDQFDHEQRRCRVCGCFANLKARIEREHCPIQKW